MSATKMVMTAEDVESFVRLFRERLLAAAAEGVDVTIHTRHGVRDTTQPGDQWRTYAPTSRFSLELHLAGGVDPRNEELPMPPPLPDLSAMGAAAVRAERTWSAAESTLISAAMTLRQHATAIERGTALAAHVIRDLRAIADLLDPP